MICLLAAQSASLHGLGPVGAVEHRRRPARPDHLAARTAPDRRAGRVLAAHSPPPPARARGLPAVDRRRRPDRPPPRAGLPGRSGAAVRCLRRPGRPAHRQRPPGRGEGPPRQRHRRAVAQRALRGGAERPPDHPGPAARGGRGRRRGPGHAGRRHGGAGRPGARLRQLLGHLVRAAVQRERVRSRRQPAPPARPRRARLAGRRRPGRPVRHHPGGQPRRPADHPAGPRRHRRGHRAAAARHRRATGAHRRHRDSASLPPSACRACSGATASASRASSRSFPCTSSSSWSRSGWTTRSS